MTAMEAPIPADQLMIVPANEAPWDDLAAIFGTTDYPGRCQCQRFKVVGWIWRFVVRKGYRGRGLTYPLARATIGFARERGARALEAYPMITQPGKEITWGEMHVGARQVSKTPGSRRSAAPPSGGWSCGSTSNKGETHVDGCDRHARWRSSTTPCRLAGPVKQPVGGLPIFLASRHRASSADRGRRRGWAGTGFRLGLGGWPGLHG